MKTIYKYELFHGQEKYFLPKDLKILSVGEQNGKIFLWAEVDTDSIGVDYYFEIIGTGWDIKDKGGERKFIGTVFVGPFVWHVFQRVSLEF